MEIPVSRSFCNLKPWYSPVAPTATSSAASVPLTYDRSGISAVAFLSLRFAKYCYLASLPIPTLSSHDLYPHVIELHANLSLRAFSPPWRPLWAGIEMSAENTPASTKPFRLKDTLRKRSRDLSKTTHCLGVESQSPSHHVSGKFYGEEVDLKYDQAIGQIMSAQANFMRVIVQLPGPRGQGLVTGGRSCAKLAEKVEQTSQPNLRRKTHPCENMNTSQAGLQDNSDDSGAGARDSFPDVKNNVAKVLSSDHDAELTDNEGKVGLELLCVVRALLKKINKKVMVGDKVLVSGIDWIDGRGMIEQVLDRETEILDPPVANVSHLLVLFAMDRPRIEPNSLSRFLVEAESTGIPFTLMLNKSDLGSPKEIADWEDKLILWGYKPLFCSVNTKSGITPLVSILSDMTSVVIGPSGVGKSSLINALRDQAGKKLWSNMVMEGCECESLRLLDSEVVQNWEDGYKEQMVGDVSERSGRGKHTTRNVTLLRLPSGGFLADTPGFNQPALLKVTTKSLPYLFPEVRSRLSKSSRCAFSDCLHIGEPDCVVGGDWERYAHYLQLLEELKKREQIDLKTFGTKRESEMRYKVKALGAKKPEPRLVLKKHRRISRQQVKQQLATEVAEEVENLE